MKYAKDSVTFEDKHDDVKRVKEALEHPERFELLCAFCHAEHHNIPKYIMDSYPKSRFAKILRRIKKNPNFVDDPMQCRQCDTFLIPCDCDVCKRGNNYCPKCKTHPRAKYMRTRSKEKI